MGWQIVSYTFQRPTMLVEMKKFHKSKNIYKDNKKWKEYLEKKGKQKKK